MEFRSSWLSSAWIFVACLTGFATSRDCECSYHPGGCVITDAAKVGFKCRCSYMGAWTCSGTAFPCVGEEQCPGNLADYCACNLGGGDCGGYINPVTECKGSGKPRIGVADSGTCDCIYNYGNGGCTIYEPAPFGWKCVCTYQGFWSCGGWAQQCAFSEVCVGEDYSYCGCQQGGGDCGGYPDKPDCPSPYFSPTCNCDKASDWNKGHYTIDEVTYDSNSFKFHASDIVVLAEKDILNDSGEVQTITINVEETLEHTSAFTYTQGISIENGVDFEGGIPLVAGGSTSFRITSSFSHTYGESECLTSSFKGEFTCNGAPHKHTKCSVIMQKAVLEVPYTMTVKHKIISNCTCDSYGVWDGTQAYNAKLFSKEMENCFSKGCV